MTRAERGHTLVELLVVVTISAILVNIAMLAWKPISASTLSLRDRASEDAELRFAVEALLADFGGADAALPTLDGDLRITREQAVAELAGAWDGDDDGIVWSLTDGDLIRHDEALDTEIVMASGLTGFVVTRPGDAETHVLLSAGSGAGARSVTLAWPE